MTTPLDTVVPVTYATLPPLRTSTSENSNGISAGGHNGAEPNSLTVGRKVDSSLAGLKVALSHMFAGNETSTSVATDKVTDGRKISCVSDGGYQPHRLPYAPPPKPLGPDSRQLSPAPHCTCLSRAATAGPAALHHHHHATPVDQWEMCGCMTEWSTATDTEDYCRSCSVPTGLNSPPPHNKFLDGVKSGGDVSHPYRNSSANSPVSSSSAFMHRSP